jgi:hypothetical protein
MVKHNQPVCYNSQFSSNPPDFNCLVNRDKQREQFIRALQLAKSARPLQTRKNVLEWHGGPGIGKTTLLRLLTHESEKQGALIASINFLKLQERNEEFLEDPTVLLEELLGSIRPEQKEVLQSFKELAAGYRKQKLPRNIIRSYFNLSPDDRIYSRPKWLDQLDTIVVEFLRLIQSLGTDVDGTIKPIVLMFDESESVDLELADWIEEAIISPISQMSRAIVVWTSRRPWRWKRPEVRRRLQSEELKPFEREMVRNQLAAASSEELAQELFGDVHVITGGHPFANAVVISELSTWGEGVTSQTVETRKAELFELIYQAFIRSYILDKLENTDVKIASELLALVRFFDTTMLRGILTEVREDKFSHYTVEQWSDLMYNLKKSQLLVWENGYAIDPDLRHLIQQYYATCRPEQYIAANDAAIAVYRDWLDRPVDNRSTYVVEQLYHLACKGSVGEEIDLDAVLQERLRQYPCRFEDREALRNALEMLKGEIEHDEELNHITHGYAQRILSQAVEEFKSQHTN